MEVLGLGADSSMQTSNVVVGTLLSRIDEVAGPAATGKLMKSAGIVEPKLGSRVRVRIKIDGRYGCVGLEKEMKLMIFGFVVQTVSRKAAAREGRGKKKKMYINFLRQW
ncbi:hypothetical protein C1H46_027659 [Malus baccata]|uniref:Uncharacterized protein n=1 Tax=Malus baccata TaxID=106549 RepID=A0A540LJZ4_MALBA|nr:hypothetical protein C1H46_027659 [Malus baccata]